MPGHGLLILPCHAMQKSLSFAYCFFALYCIVLLSFQPPCNLYFIIYLGIVQHFFVIVVLIRHQSTHKYSFPGIATTSGAV